MINDSDYKLIDGVNAKTYSVECLFDKYKGIVYTYSTVKMNEEVVDGENICRLSFNYKVESIPESVDGDALKDDVDFQNHIGEILAHIITNYEYQIGNNDEKP